MRYTFVGGSGALYTADHDHASPTDLPAEIEWQLEGTGYRGLEAGHYSLSVGDTVTIAETVLACTPLGWHKVTVGPSTGDDPSAESCKCSGEVPAGGFGELEIGGVVGAEVVAKLPHAWKESALAENRVGQQGVDQMSPGHGNAAESQASLTGGRCALRHEMFYIRWRSAVA